MTATPRIRVVSGGTPEPDQLAALVLAFDARNDHAGRASTTRAQQPAWRRAAIREGVGGPAAVRPADLGGPPDGFGCRHPGA